MQQFGLKEPLSRERHVSKNQKILLCHLYRLPLFQGAAVDYILPLLILGGSDSTFCNSKLSKNQDSGNYFQMHVALAVGGERTYLFISKRFLSDKCVSICVHFLKYINPIKIVLRRQQYDEILLECPHLKLLNCIVI